MSNNYNNDFIDFLHLMSYNALFNFVDTSRDTGKTTKFKYISLVRFLKSGKKTIWVRTFENDAKETARDFYNGKNAKSIKLAIKNGYNIKPEQIQQNGQYIYYTDPKTKKRTWFIKIVHLSQAQSLKGNEIDEADIIVYDEYRTTKSRVNRFIGNQAKEFIDIVVTIARSHKIRVFLLGNKETYNNPFYDYLRITPPPEDFEGIKTYKNGSIAIMQVNKMPKQIEENTTHSKLKKALENTPYLNYLYDGKTQGINRLQIEKLPSNAYYLCGFIIDNSKFAMYSCNNKLFFKSGIDENQHIYTNTFTNKYKFCERLIVGDKKHFKILQFAIKHNAIYFCDLNCYERVQDLIKILGI